MSCKLFSKMALCTGFRDDTASLFSAGSTGYLNIKNPLYNIVGNWLQS